MSAGRSWSTSAAWTCGGTGGWCIQSFRTCLITFLSWSRPMRTQPRRLDLDLVIGPNMSVSRDDSRRGPGRPEPPRPCGGLRDVSLFCGGRKIHAEVRAHWETVEDIALFDRAVRSDITFALGGVHSPAPLADYRREAPGRRLVVLNGMACSLAQRRRLLSPSAHVVHSARDTFLADCRWNDLAYTRVLGGAV